MEEWGVQKTEAYRGKDFPSEHRILWMKLQGDCLEWKKEWIQWNPSGTSRQGRGMLKDIEKE